MSAKSTNKAKGRRPHEEPSAASLREIPPIDPEKSISFGRGADGFRRARAFTALMREHMRKGGAARASSRRTLSLDDAVWSQLDRMAEAQGLSARALVRNVIVRWVLDARETTNAKPRKRARKVA